MFSVTLLMGLIYGVGSYRIGSFNRSGIYEKFPQSILFNNNNFYNVQKYTIQTNFNTCGTRSVHFNPKRAAKIIGGKNWFILHTFYDSITKRVSVIGESAPYGSFPWQVEIQIYNYENGIYEHHCGAAVIGERTASTLKNSCHFDNVEISFAKLFFLYM